MCSASPPKASDNDAWALLSLRSAPASPTRLSSCWSPDEPKGVAVARLDGRDFEYTMRLPQRRLTVGRSSSKGDVDINMEHSSFVSRNHLQIHYSTDNNGASRFFLTCSGKNGIFVDGIFQRKGAEALELPRSCTLRFPSTTLKISFQALIDSEIPPPPPPPVALPPKYAKPMQPLHINIPPAPRPDAPSLISPCPSPTGTISAANSCPTSPRSSSSSVRSMLALDLPSAAAAAFARKQSSSDEMKEPLPCGIITGAEEEVAGSGSEKAKPPYSYAQLIVQAITSHPDRQLTLSGIYAYISKNYPYYRASDKGWQNSIRHNLSLNRFFVKVPRSQEEPGKGSFWRIDSGSEGKLMEQAFRRRRQRVSCFRSPAGGDLSSRSAPVSPSHYDGSFTPEGTPHSAGLVPDAHSVTEANSDVKQESKSQSLATSSASQRLLQLTNDLRFIQSAPVSPQGGPVQLMTMPNSVPVPTSIAVSRTSSAGMAFHPLSTLTAKQGVYLLQQTTIGGTTVPTPMALANVTSATKEADKSSVMLLKSIGNGNMLSTDMVTQQHQQSQRQDATVVSASSSSSSSSSSSLFGQLPITFIQPGSSTHSNDLIQKLLQQGAMVVGRMPDDSQSPAAVYSLPSGMMQSGLQPFHLVLGTQLMKQPDPSGATEQGKAPVQPQIVVLPGGQGIKIEKLSPSKTTLGSLHTGTQPGQLNSVAGSGIKTEESLSASATASDGRKAGQNVWTDVYTKFKEESVSSSELQSSETKPMEKVEDSEDNQMAASTLAAGLSCSATTLMSVNSDGSVSHVSADQHPLVGSSSAAKDSVIVSQLADYVKAEKRPVDTASLLVQAADRDCKRFKVDSDQ